MAEHIHVENVGTQMETSEAFMARASGEMQEALAKQKRLMPFSNLPSPIVKMGTPSKPQLRP